MAPAPSVLIVDDEPAVRDLIARWVVSMGLRPDTAANVDEALVTLRLHHYDMAVIDVMMPGRDGHWLAGELRRVHPQTAVIMATAYSDLVGEDAQQAPVADFLIKPFARERFALAVDRGHQWRKQALAEVHRQAMLSIELRDRAAHILHALDERTAQEALALIEVDYEVLPTILSAEDALAHPEIKVNEKARTGNITKHVQLEFGPVDEAVASAAAVSTIAW